MNHEDYVPFPRYLTVTTPTLPIDDSTCKRAFLPPDVERQEHPRFYHAPHPENGLIGEYGRPSFG